MESVDHLPDSFSVTIISDEQCFWFPGNTSTDFRNLINGLIEFRTGLIQFGLSEIFFDCPAYDPKPVEAKKPKLALTTGFGTQDITVYRILLIETLNYESDKILNIIKLIELINELNIRLGIKFLLEMAFTDQETFHIKIKQNIPDRFIRLPQEFAKCIGFDTTDFPTGTYTGKPVRMEGCYVDPGVPLKLIITENRWEQNAVVTAPTTDKDFDELLSAIINAITPTKVKIGFVHEQVNDSIFLDVTFYEGDIKLKLSEEINLLFGLEKDFVFVKSTNIVIPIQNFSPGTPSADIICPDRDDNSFVYILCDIVQPQLVGGKLVPAIAVLNRDPTRQRVYRVFDPVTYLTPKRQQVEWIHIQIVDRNLEPLPPSLRPSMIKLHFKKTI
ncbi:hypothetical protein Fcan01_16956 [Folsomia candida]|uniref:Uncharacterized protein n=1 Tax=Folsomia candida TaxID=158441 RepID=A0A226DTL8_FOLCA|nr:hypothetical protein Fcan01_16956 [Folsomia candida]